jgi:hypothetical protein
MEIKHQTRRRQNSYRAKQTNVIKELNENTVIKNSTKEKTYKGKLSKYYK